MFSLHLSLKIALIFLGAAFLLLIGVESQSGLRFWFAIGAVAAMGVAVALGSRAFGEEWPRAVIESIFIMLLMAIFLWF